MPVIELAPFLECIKNGEAQITPEAFKECLKVVQCLHKFGLLTVRDPRVDYKDNDTYVDMMEEFFAKAGAKFEKGENVEEIRPDCNYQVGATPHGIEIARDHSEKIKSLITE
jgi:isopenicillin N synthase-like dioxygenase